MLSKNQNFFRFLEFDQIHSLGVFKPPDHESGHQKSLRCTSEDLHVDFLKSSTLSFDVEIK